jgi:hypothetical protein
MSLTVAPVAVAGCQIQPLANSKSFVRLPGVADLLSEAMQPGLRRAGSDGTEAWVTSATVTLHEDSRKRRNWVPCALGVANGDVFGAYTPFEPGTKVVGRLGPVANLVGQQVDVQQLWVDSRETEQMP